MDKLLLLKGKLEMAKRTIQLQKGSLKKSSLGEASASREPLVYKDAPDGDSGSEADEAMNERDSDSENDSEMADEASSEEEIKEIPLKKLAQKNLKKKRARL